MLFEELNLNDDILDALYDMQFETCTPIQEKAIPVILDGHDLLATAQTGTGKTAAFLLPVMNRIMEEDRTEHKIKALVLLPTRELAQQVDMLMEGFGYYSDLSSIAVYGGNDGLAFAQQKKGLELGGEVVVATPGRLISHIRLNNVDFSGLEYLILDEADRMLDIGFFDDIMEIVKCLPKERQTVMFSATFPKDVEKLAVQILNNPKEIKIAVSKPADGISQNIYLLHETQKIPLICELLQQPDRGKCIVFSSSKDKVRDLFRALKQRKLNVAQMHSGLEQSERTQVMLDFKNGKLQALIATDVVSRGIDIDDIELVVNLDTPYQAEDYVHRVGRTARAGAKGTAITLVTPQDRFRFDKIEKFLDKTINRLTLPEDVAAIAPPVEDVPGKDPRKGSSYKKFTSKGRKKQ